MATDDVDALFRLADEAKRTCRAEEGDDDFNDAEGEVEAFGGAYANARSVQTRSRALA